MSIVGLLPASGSASRMGGIPKFCLPISDGESILEWHVARMRTCCDRIRICTRAHWIPIIQGMAIKDIELLAIEPSTMSDAVARMWMDRDDTHVVGMPDTFIHQSDGQFYNDLAKSEAGVTLAAWPCHADLMGRVGQIEIDANDRVTDSVDKRQGCAFPFMWGAMAFKGDVPIDRALAHPGLQIKSWIDSGLTVRAVRAAGTYMDIGSVSGLKMLYRSI